MTVIAWDGKTLAADKRATTDDGCITTVTKLMRFEDKLIATSGVTPISRELRGWYMAGAKPKAFPACARDDRASLIVVSRGTTACYTIGPHPQLSEDRFGVWGSGRDFALAAMHCGKTAREAVEIACKLNAFCGNGIDTLEHDPA